MGGESGRDRLIRWEERYFEIFLSEMFEVRVMLKVLIFKDQYFSRINIFQGSIFHE